MLPVDFYKIVEKPKELQYILYGDTDSIFLNIPVSNVDDISFRDRWNICEGHAIKINELIERYVKDYLLPQCNIDPSMNKTYFKTEMLMESILFLNIKKQYAYKLIIEKGKILKHPEIKYTGIQTIRSDAAKITQDILRSMIEDVIFNDKIHLSEKMKYIKEKIKQFRNKFNEDVSNFDFDYIGIPSKWWKKEWIIDGMKLYNQLIGSEIFSFGSSCRYVYCNIPTSATKVLCVPYNYDKRYLEKKIKESNITIDKDTHWSKIFTKTCKRIVNLISDII